MQRILFVTLVLIASCSRFSRSSCEPVTGEISQLAGMNVYRACEVDTPAVAPRNDGSFAFTPAPKRLGCFRAELEFIVDTAGVPIRRSVKVVKANDANFAAAASGHVLNLRYKPAVYGGLPAAQIVRYQKVDQLIAAPPGSTGDAVHATNPRC